VLTGPRLLEIDRHRREVLRAGTPITLVRLVVFTLQDELAVAQALRLVSPPSYGRSAALVETVDFPTPLVS
jgi:hypothetical protein